VRGAWAWALGIIAALVIALLVAAVVGRHDEKGKTVSAGDWAASVCESVGTWRGEMESIINGVGQSPSVGDLGVDEPQSETTDGRTQQVRDGLISAIRATDTLVDGIANAGIPATGNGQQAATQVANWADSTHANLQKAHDSLQTAPTSLQDAVSKLTGAAGALGSALTSGVTTLAGVAHSNPELRDAFVNAEECQNLQQEDTSE
jgi:hypothetical protein